MTLTSVAIIVFIYLVFALAAIIDEIRKAAQCVRTQISITSGEVCQEIKELRVALPYLDPELRQIIRLIESDQRRTDLTEIRSVLDSILLEVRDISDPPERDSYGLVAPDWNGDRHGGQPRG